MVLAMKWYVTVSVSIGFSCLLSKSYRLMTILSLLISINFSNDLFSFSMSEFDKFLFLLHATNGFDCTYICAMFTTINDSIPRGIDALKQLESDPSVAASNIIHSKRGVPIPAPLTKTQNSRVDAPRGGAVGTSLGDAVSVRSVVRALRCESEKFACTSKRYDDVVVA